VLHVPVPVHVGGLAVYPDDLLHGDLNGVTSIPREIAAEMADVGDEFVAAEKFIMDALRAPEPTVKGLREARAKAGACIAALRSRVSRAP
jgi:regulator of RNase E activity RraA